MPKAKRTKKPAVKVGDLRAKRDVTGGGTKKQQQKKTELPTEQVTLNYSKITFE